MRNLNIVSKGYTGNTTIPKNLQRGYLMIAMTNGATGTVEFGEGGGQLPLPADSFYEPLIVPSSEFTITTTGSFVLLLNAP